MSPVKHLVAYPLITAILYHFRCYLEKAAPHYQTAWILVTNVTTQQIHPYQQPAMGIFCLSLNEMKLVIKRGEIRIDSWQKI
jgi:hypothetical protein